MDEIIKPGPNKFSQIKALLLEEEEKPAMNSEGQFFILKEKAVPDVLLKVVKAKRLLNTGRAVSVQEAADAVGISRSSFYKYKEDIYPFHDDTKGRTITFVVQIADEQGLLSDILKVVAEYKANILTIHQSIPVNEVATLTISIEVLPQTGDISKMMQIIENKDGIHSIQILARE